MNVFVVGLNTGGIGSVYFLISSKHVAALVPALDTLDTLIMLGYIPLSRSPDTAAPRCGHEDMTLGSGTSYILL